MSADRVSLPASAPVSAPAPTAVPDNGLAVNVTTLSGGKAQRVEATPAAQAPAGGEQRPAWLPEKFKTPEAMAQAYAALEQRMGAVAAVPQAAAPAPQAPAQGQEPAPATAPAGAGDLVQRMTQEWASTGQVSPESRKAFQERTGLDPSFIDNQIAHLEAQNARNYELATRRLGGEAAVSELTEWAKSRLSQEDRETFNRAVYSNDPRLAQLAMDGLAARYEAEVGRAPRVMAGRKPVPEAGGLVAFQSAAEWQTARRDPKYKQDPAYRQQVEDRLRLSSRMGIL